jgi:hypothetical protein
MGGDGGGSGEVESIRLGCGHQDGVDYFILMIPAPTANPVQTSAYLGKERGFPDSNLI